MKTVHKIILGDALKVLKNIPDNSIDLVFADPPYNMSKKNGLAWKYSKHVTMQEDWDMFSKDEYLQFNQLWLKEALRVLKHGGSLWISGSFHKDRKSTRLNSSHMSISYAVFCLKNEPALAYRNDPFVLAELLIYLRIQYLSA